MCVCVCISFKIFGVSVRYKVMKGFEVVYFYFPNVVQIELETVLCVYIIKFISLACL